MSPEDYKTLRYVPGTFPQNPDSLNQYIKQELEKIQSVIGAIVIRITALEKPTDGAG